MYFTTDYSIGAVDHYFDQFYHTEAAFSQMDVQLCYAAIRHTRSLCHD